MLMTTIIFCSCFTNAEMIKKETIVEKSDDSYPCDIGSTSLYKSSKIGLKDINGEETEDVASSTVNSDSGGEFTPPFTYDYSWKFAIGIGNNVAKVSVSKSSGRSKYHTYHQGSGSGYGWAAAGTKIWVSWTSTVTDEVTFSMYGHAKGTIKNDYESKSMVWGWIQIYDGWPDSHEEPLKDKCIFDYRGSADKDFSGSLSMSVTKGKQYSIVFDCSAGSDGYAGTTYANFYDSGYVDLDKIKITGSGSLEWSPGRRDFGDIKVGECSSPKSFELENNGIFRSTGEVYTDSDVFIITSGGGRFDLDAGESKTVKVKFCPNEQVTWGHILTAKTDDGEYEHAVLQGTGPKSKSTISIFELIRSFKRGQFFPAFFNIF
jgi:hypothetical protein